jgi:hypothetical protein
MLHELMCIPRKIRTRGRPILKTQFKHPNELRQGSHASSRPYKWRDLCGSAPYSIMRRKSVRSPVPNRRGGTGQAPPIPARCPLPSAVALPGRGWWSGRAMGSPLHSTPLHFSPPRSNLRSSPAVRHYLRRARPSHLTHRSPVKPAPRCLLAIICCAWGSSAPASHHQR